MNAKLKHRNLHFARRFMTWSALYECRYGSHYRAWRFTLSREISLVVKRIAHTDWLPDKYRA